MRSQQHDFLLAASYTFLPRDALSAKRGIAIACRLSVRLSVRPSVTLVNCDHIGWKSSKIISPSVSLACSLLATQTSRVYSKGNTLKFSPELRTCNGAEYQVKFFLSMPIYAFHGAILGVCLLEVTALRCVLLFKRCP